MSSAIKVKECEATMAAKRGSCFAVRAGGGKGVARRRIRCNDGAARDDGGAGVEFDEEVDAAEMGMIWTLRRRHPG